MKMAYQFNHQKILRKLKAAGYSRTYKAIIHFAADTFASKSKDFI